jgi:hypothetical protein
MLLQLKEFIFKCSQLVEQIDKWLTRAAIVLNYLVEFLHSLKKLLRIIKFYKCYPFITEDPRN